MSTIRCQFCGEGYYPSYDTTNGLPHVCYPKDRYTVTERPILFDAVVPLATVRMLQREAFMAGCEWDSDTEIEAEARRRYPAG